jgi:hypothetical protein
VAGQHRAAGAVQSLTMSTQAIRDGEITALHAAMAIPRHIRTQALCSAGARAVDGNEASASVTIVRYRIISCLLD